MNWTAPRVEVVMPDVMPTIGAPSATTFVLSSEEQSKSVILGPDGKAIEREITPKPRIGFLK